MSNNIPLVWIDCEMTGLDCDKDVIIEIACFITNGDLELLDKEGWEVAIHQSKEKMDKMGEWCTKTHGESGLTVKVLASKITPEQASSQLLEYIKQYIPEAGQGLLAGNSIHADKAFLRKQPYARIINHLSYRLFDVSTLKMAAKIWCEEDILVGVPKKQLQHTARADILESIAEAKYYKEAIFQRSRGLYTYK